MIKFIDYGASYRKHKVAYDTAIQNVLNAGDLILRKDGEEFERRLAEYVGTDYAVGLNSGTDALILSLRVLGVGRGDEVITVTNTFKATVTAIRAVGATPVLIDINEHYLMDENLLADAITERTKAIIPVHLSGDVCDMTRIKEIAGDIPVIEDAAQALGGKHAGKMAGSMGTTGCFSFYPAKIMGCFGDAGAVTTNNRLLYEELLEERNHYKLKPGKDGCNSRLDNIQAAVLNVKFNYLQDILDRRRSIANIYSEGLEGLPITLPHNNPERVWQDYIIRTPDRDDLRAYLTLQGIETMTPPILPHQELNIVANVPKSEDYNEEYLRLPCNPDITETEAEYVVKSIREHYA